ncbi:MAG: sigma-70 family RNA polymerase sigma factor [Pseudomonadota bacterium]
MGDVRPADTLVARRTLCHVDSVEDLKPSPINQDREALTQALAHVAQGDRSALQEVYARTSAKLFGLCLRILGNRSEAEDALQEIYLVVWRRAASFDPQRASPITWLSVLARNRAIDMLRAADRPGRADPLEQALDIPDDQPSALAVLEADEENVRLMGCVGALDAHQADAIRAAFFGGLTYPELASRFTVPLGTMKSWIRRGLLRLRECLEQ